MANGHYPEQSPYQGGGQSAYAPAGQTGQTLTRTTGCRCHSTGSGRCTCHPAGPEATCCDLTCFERPRYFCGHLLTDADLSLDQRYVIEKQKLYHRALHGHGIVCGLRLTCDHLCCGNILIGEGFGIDDCGHDLIVCEQTSFDVLATLREKKLLIPPPKPEDCVPPMTPEDCRIRQCFYVVACYEEEGQEYATPLTPTCGPSLSDCEPTRIRETVRFDVVDELPRQYSALEELKSRVEHCFALFTQGQFAKALKEDIVARALAGDTDPAQHQAMYEAFCKLRGLLLLYLETHPDNYNCRIKDEIAAIGCPLPPGYREKDGQTAQKGQYTNQGEGQDTDYVRQQYATDFKTAFCRLIELAYHHVISCVMGELAFPCAEPAHSSCVVLGTVEVENDCVVRVCNCPRTYVWSFASIVPVLMASLLGNLACEQEDQETVAEHTGDDFDDERKKNGSSACCAVFTPDGGCETWVGKLRDGGSSISDLATGVFNLVEAVSKSFQYGLDPRRTDALSLRSMRGRKVQDVESFFSQRDLSIEILPAPEQFVPGNPIEELSAQLHQTTADHLVAYQQNGTVVEVRQKALSHRVSDLERELAELKQLIANDKGQPPSGGETNAASRGRQKRGKP